MSFGQWIAWKGHDVKICFLRNYAMRTCGLLTRSCKTLKKTIPEIMKCCIIWYGLNASKKVFAINKGNGTKQKDFLTSSVREKQLKHREDQEFLWIWLLHITLVNCRCDLDYSIGLSLLLVYIKAKEGKEHVCWLARSPRLVSWAESDFPRIIRTSKTGFSLVWLHSPGGHQKYCRI